MEITEMNWLMDINSISMIFLSPICEFEIQRNFMELSFDLEEQIERTLKLWVINPSNRKNYKFYLKFFVQSEIVE